MSCVVSAGGELHCLLRADVSERLRSRLRHPSHLLAGSPVGSAWPPPLSSRAPRGCSTCADSPPRVDLRGNEARVGVRHADRRWRAADRECKERRRPARKPHCSQHRPRTARLRRDDGSTFRPRSTNVSRAGPSRSGSGGRPLRPGVTGLNLYSLLVAVIGAVVVLVAYHAMKRIA